MRRQQEWPLTSLGGHISLRTPRSLAARTTKGSGQGWSPSLLETAVPSAVARGLPAESLLGSALLCPGLSCPARSFPECQPPCSPASSFLQDGVRPTLCYLQGFWVGLQQNRGRALPCRKLRSPEEQRPKQEGGSLGCSLSPVVIYRLRRPRETHGGPSHHIVSTAVTQKLVRERGGSLRFLGCGSLWSRMTTC